jgi:hypothetical protein
MRLMVLATIAMLSVPAISNAQQYNLYYQPQAAQQAQQPQSRSGYSYEPQRRGSDGQYRYSAPVYDGLDPSRQDLTTAADLLGKALNHRCMTRLCEDLSARIDSGEIGRMAVNPNAPEDQNACIKANDDVGKEIGRLGYNITQHEEGRGSKLPGGTIPSYRASEIRGLLYTESYYARQSLRSIISIGDAKQCGIMREATINLLHQIITTRL